MKSLNILIVEDEILIAETIKYYLEERDHNVLSIAISYDEAVQAYRLRCPDLVLLDIRLYGQKSGIDFANFLSEQISNPPYVYLTSQYDQRILAEALKTNPSGYLTKPIQKETLWTTVEAAYHLHEASQVVQPVITLQDGKNNYNINANEILYIQSDHVYVTIITIRDQKITVRKSLQQLLSLCESEFLFICHRSYIINLKHIQEWNNDEIILKNNFAVPISRSKRDEFLLKLKSFNP
ncbi:MAG: DNA-binding response regulator [Saprospiraceae bacterium]|nr:DNA-binding response regulator [Saprospiraceae bacterium]